MASPLRRRRSRLFRPALQHLERRSLLSTASFLGSDTTTQGDWRAAYGGDGYDIVNDDSGPNPSWPSYATVNISNAWTYTWDKDTGNPYALQDAAGTGDIAPACYTGQSFDIHIDLTDGYAHRVSLYALNWDGVKGWQDGYQDRSERFDVLDAATGDELNSEPLPSFQGTYLSWVITGDVIIRVTNTNPDSNAVVSGIFFDAPSGNTVTIAATTPTISEASQVPGEFTVTRQGDLSNPLTVYYYTTGTSIPDQDYESIANNVTIPAGSASAMIDITPLGYVNDGGDGTVVLTLLPDEPIYRVGAQGSATMTIQEKPPTVSIRATTLVASEGDLQSGKFTVSTDNVLLNDLTVYYTVGGTANPGDNYAPLSGSVVIPAGSDSATFDVTPLAGGNDGPGVTVVATLSPDPDYAVGTLNSDTVTIVGPAVNYQTSTVDFYWDYHYDHIIAATIWVFDNYDSKLYLTQPSHGVVPSVDLTGGGANGISYYPDPSFLSGEDSFSYTFVGYNPLFSPVITVTTQVVTVVVHPPSSSPIIEYNHTGATASDTNFTDVIGDDATVNVEPPPGSGKTITSVSWSIAGERTYSGQKVDPTTGGFINTTFVPSLDTDQSITFYWDEKGGTPTITATAYYSDGTSGTTSLSGTVLVPTASVRAAFPTGITGVKLYSNDPEWGQAMRLGDKTSTPQVPGIRWTSTVSLPDGLPPGFTSKTGMVQVMTSSLVERSRTSYLGTTSRWDVYAYRNAKGNVVFPSPLLDDTPDGSNSVFYQGSGLNGGAKANDSPSLALLSGYNYVDMTNFRDTLMFQPSGGIWVPLGNWGWGFNAAATYVFTYGGAGGYFSVSNVTPPFITPFAVSTAWPTWADIASKYGTWVQVMP
jgi:hypothetical protein